MRETTLARREIADALLAQICESVAHEHEERKAVAATLRRCQAQAEALASSALESHARPSTAGRTLERLQRLRRALNDGQWKIAVRRLGALARLEERTWRRLEGTPCWAVARALGREHADERYYVRGINALGRNLGEWASPHAGAAAKEARVRLSGPPEPSVMDALLRTWPWPEAMPPLPAAAACAEVGRTKLCEDEWAAALTLESVKGRIGARALAQEIEALAPQLRDIVEKAIEREACDRLAELFWDKRGETPGASERQDVLQRMRALWARSKHLVPRGPEEHALRVVPTGGHELITPALGWLPRSLVGIVHSPPSLAWRVPYTDAARAVAITKGDLADEAGTYRAGSISTAHAHKCVRVGRVPGWEADYAAYVHRAQAIEAILQRLADELESARECATQHEEGNQCTSEEQQR